MQFIRCLLALMFFHHTSIEEQFCIALEKGDDVQVARIVTSLQTASKNLCLKPLNLFGDTAIHIATRKNNLSTVLLLLDYGVAPTQIARPIGWMPLHIAAIAGSMPLVSVFINAGTPIDSTDNLNQSSLFYAAHSGHYDVVDFLLDQGAAAFDRSFLFSTPLHEAIARQHLSIVHLLLYYVFEKPVHFVSASERFRPDMLNAQDYLGYTPVHLAVKHNQIEIVRYLARLGADLDTQNHIRNAPLHTAARNGNFSLIKILVEQGATISLLNRDEHTPLGQVLVNTIWANVCMRRCAAFMGLIDVNAEEQSVRYLLAVNGYEYDDCTGRAVIEDIRRSPYPQFVFIYHDLMRMIPQVLVHWCPELPQDLILLIRSFVLDKQFACQEQCH